MAIPRRPATALLIAPLLAATWPPARLAAAQDASLDPDPEPDGVTIARAFGAAWNAHDLEGVVAFFAPDGVVREAGYVYDAGAGETAQYVYGAVLATLAGTPPFVVDGTDVVWRGRAGVREWARRLFTLRHRAEATGHAATAAAGGPARTGTVTWRYRAHLDPYQTVAGVPPVEGIAAASVRAGRITVLVLAAALGSTEQRDAALLAAGASTQPAWGVGSAPSIPVFTAPRASGTPPSPPAPTELCWPLAAAGLGGAALALSAARQRVRRGRFQ